MICVSWWCYGLFVRVVCLGGVVICVSGCCCDLCVIVLL